jgi:CIC family chloride channel protein
LVACGAGAGMGAAYGVPLGGALFALEVMRGKLALRFVLPALFTALIATGISWLALLNAPTDVIPSFSDSASVLLWTLIAGPLLGLASVVYVRMIAWADRNRPNGWKRFAVPFVVMGLLGLTSYWFPQILGNGQDLSELLFTSQVAPMLMLALLFLKPIATTMCVRSGAPGGMFTPSLTAGALLGGVLGMMWSAVWPGTPPGLFALLGAGAMIGATTQGPISAVVLLMELTGRDRSFVLPLLLTVCGATLVARTIEPRSIYDARLTDEQIAERQRLRDIPSQ